MTTTNKPATILGCAIGDALGVPWEMKSALNPHLQAWDGLFKDGATFHKWSKAGMWSDDTLMSIALANSLIERNGEYDPATAAQKYLDWFNSGNTRGIGSTTAEALTHLRLGATWEESGVMTDKCDGNGTAMRISPMALVYHNDLTKLIDVAVKDASITHNRPEPKAGSIAVALGVAYLLNGEKPANLIDVVMESESVPRLLCSGTYRLRKVCWTMMKNPPRLWKRSVCLAMSLIPLLPRSTV